MARRRSPAVPDPTPVGASSAATTPTGAATAAVHGASHSGVPVSDDVTYDSMTSGSMTASAKARPGRPARRAGRPPGDTGDVRARLLDAAVRRYARQGIAATTLRDIADEAGVTPALVHYYFGGREALQAAAIEERVLAVIATFREPLLSAIGDIRAQVHGFVGVVIDTALAHPWLPQLWVREVLQEDGALRALMLERIGPLLPRLLVAQFADAQARGRLNPRLDPRLLVASTVGQTMFLVASAPIWRALFDAGDIDAALLKRHVLALLESGLELNDD